MYGKLVGDPKNCQVFHFSDLNSIHHQQNYGGQGARKKIYSALLLIFCRVYIKDHSYINGFLFELTSINKEEFKESCNEDKQYAFDPFYYEAHRQLSWQSDQLPPSERGIEGSNPGEGDYFEILSDLFFYIFLKKSPCLRLFAQMKNHLSTNDP